MRIIIDAMGGDNAPRDVVIGTCRARKEYGSDVGLTLVGDERVIRRIADASSLSLDGIDIVHTDVTIGMDENPMAVVKSKSNSSMSIGLKMLRDDNEYGYTGDAFISAGSTGALHLGSSLIVGKMQGVRRPCIAALLPFPTPVLLLDAGANPKITEEYLLEWGIMGSVYMRDVYGCENPRVGLLNNGTEECKGTDVYVSAHALLSDADINFVGNVESREIPFGACDVLVCDGFTGNIVLKFVEGMGKFMMQTLRDIYSANGIASASFLLVKPQIKKVKKSFDASEHGGAPFLGLKRPVIKAHGSSDDTAIYNAIRQSVRCVENNITDKMRDIFAK